MIRIILTVIAVAVASAGYRSVRVAEDGRVAESMSLRAVAHNTRSPEMGKIYHERQRRKRDRSEFS